MSVAALCMWALGVGDIYVPSAVNLSMENFEFLDSSVTARSNGILSPKTTISACHGTGRRSTDDLRSGANRAAQILKPFRMGRRQALADDTWSLKPQPFGQYFGHVHDSRGVTLGRNAVGHHGKAKWTPHRHGLGPGRQCFPGSNRANPLFRVLLHPHPAPARAATKRLFPIARHFMQITAG